MTMIWIVNKRLWLDNNTYDKLRELFRKTKIYVNRNELLSLIICEWVNTEGIVDFDNVLYIDKHGNAENISRNRFIYFKISESLWNDFTRCCSDKKLNVNAGFKITINYFIHINENNYENIFRYILDNNNNNIL